MCALQSLKCNCLGGFIRAFKTWLPSIFNTGLIMFSDGISTFNIAMCAKKMFHKKASALCENYVWYSLHEFKWNYGNMETFSKQINFKF